MLRENTEFLCKLDYLGQNASLFFVISICVIFFFLINFYNNMTLI